MYSRWDSSTFDAPPRGLGVGAALIARSIIQ